MFGFIKSIFGGIVSFLKNVLGLGKKSEYFLELDESKSDTTTAEAPAAVGQPESEAVVEASKAKSAATKKAAKPAAKAAASSAPASAAAKAGPTDRESMIAAAVRQTNAASSGQSGAANPGFATNFELLMSVKIDRRTPGPSLDPFKEMARSTPSARR